MSFFLIKSERCVLRAALSMQICPLREGGASCSIAFAHLDLADALVFCLVRRPARSDFFLSSAPLLSPEHPACVYSTDPWVTRDTG